jgi:hypothetical protein
LNQEINPTEETKPVTELAEQPIKVVSSSSKKIIYNIPLIKRISIIVIIILLIIGAGIGAYIWRDSSANASEKTLNAEIVSLKKSKLDLEQLLADAIAKNALINNTSDNSTCIAITPSESVIDNIKASIISGNLAALEGYMASSVNVILAETGEVEPFTPNQAVAAIAEFVSSDNETWEYDFSLTNEVLTTYRNGNYGKYFSTISIVGKNADNKVISFSFDCTGKINSVFMASSENLLIN